jgi:hypothetical protein
MKKNFDLNKMGLAPMTGEEMQEIDGEGGVVFRYCCSFWRTAAAEK